VQPAVFKITLYGPADGVQGVGLVLEPQGGCVERLQFHGRVSTQIW